LTLKLTNLWKHEQPNQLFPLPANHKLDILDMQKALPYIGPAPPASAPVFELRVNGEDRFVSL